MRDFVIVLFYFRTAGGNPALVSHPGGVVMLLGTLC